VALPHGRRQQCTHLCHRQISFARPLSPTFTSVAVSAHTRSPTPPHPAKQPTAASWRGGGITSIPTCTMTAETPSAAWRCVARSYAPGGQLAIVRVLVRVLVVGADAVRCCRVLAQQS
jgi:hypothetical protein